MAENRYIGKYPVIGIRPVIDARRGYLNVRCSLEEQTMNMASSAKKLFEENSLQQRRAGKGSNLTYHHRTRGRSGEMCRLF